MANQRTFPEGIKAGINKSGADIAAKKIVMLDVSEGGLHVEVAADGSLPMRGITLEDIDNTYHGDVAEGGIVPLILGEDSVAAGAMLTADSAGRGVAAAAGEWCIGRALQGGDTDDVIECEILKVQLDSVV